MDTRNKDTDKTFDYLSFFKTIPHGHIDYNEFTKTMRQFNNKDERGDFILHGVIVFQESETFSGTLEERSYHVTNDNKAWKSGLGGYSIYGSSLDGTDPCSRLEGFMEAERGGPKGWKVEYCYFTKVTYSIN